MGALKFIALALFLWGTVQCDEVVKETLEVERRETNVVVVVASANDSGRPRGQFSIYIEDSGCKPKCGGREPKSEHKSRGRKVFFANPEDASRNVADPSTNANEIDASLNKDDDPSQNRDDRDGGSSSAEENVEATVEQNRAGDGEDRSLDSDEVEESNAMEELKAKREISEYEFGDMDYSQFREKRAVRKPRKAKRKRRKKGKRKHHYRSGEIKLRSGKTKLKKKKAKRSLESQLKELDEELMGALF